MDNQIYSDTRVGTVGGTLLVILLQTSIHEIAVTALTAAVGAAVSFITSVLLGYIKSRLRRK